MPIISEAMSNRLWGTEQLQRARNQLQLVIGSLSDYAGRARDISLAIAEAAEREVPLYLNISNKLVPAGGELAKTADRFAIAFQSRDEALALLRERRSLRLKPAADRFLGGFSNAIVFLETFFRNDSPERELLIASPGKPAYRGVLAASVRWMDDTAQALILTSDFNYSLAEIDAAIARQIFRRKMILATGAVALLVGIGIGMGVVFAINRDSNGYTSR